MYEFYLDKMLLPVAPKKLTLKIKNQNKTLNLINDFEMSILKPAGLTEINFECLIPQNHYPFAKYLNGYQSPDHFLSGLKKLKVDQKPFPFIVFRMQPNGMMLFHTNLMVSLEEYTQTEDVSEGFDIIVSIKLKKYVEFKTKKIVLETGEDGTQIKEEVARETANAPSSDRYIVKKGDCLWNIAKYFYGDGGLWRKIYDANADKINNPNLIYPGQELVIPALKGD